MQVGIDWTAAAIFGVAFVLSQIRTIPLRIRYGVLALACGVIAAMRMRGGAVVGPNLLFVCLAAGLCVYYLFRAISAPKR